MIDPAEIDQIRVFGFHWDDHRPEVGTLLSPVVTQNFEAELRGFVPEGISHSLAVEGLVMHDINGFDFEILRGKSGPDRSLDVVPAANAVDVWITAIGDLGGGIGGGDHWTQRGFLNLPRGGGPA